MSNDNRSGYPLHVASRHLLDAGLSIIPIASLEAKNPGLESWKPFMSAPADPETAAHWFIANGRPASPGVAIVCGQVSGGLTVLDFDRLEDGTCLYDDYCALLEEVAPGLLRRLAHATTRGGGYHIFFRCQIVEGNTKLAERSVKETWIETRGEGGYVLAAPTPGYTMIHGSLRAIPTISIKERERLLSVARSFNQRVENPQGQMRGKGESPADTYNADTTPRQMASLLVRHQWTIVSDRGDVIALRRPGKAQGISATIRSGLGFPVFYCFSTNAEHVPIQKGTTPFGLYAHLEFAGDYAKAARALHKGGIGVLSRPTAPTAPVAPPPPPDDEDVYTPTLVTHKALRGLHFDPLGWVVPNVIPEGCTLCVGGPKTGKSWLLLDLAISTEFGYSMFGLEKVAQNQVAYLYLEDGDRVAQGRCMKLAAEGSDKLHFFFKWRPFDQGGLDDLRKYLDDNPATKLVIIDTLARVRPLSKTGKGLYEQDYAALKELTDLSHEKRVSFIVAHHTRKMASEDAMDLVSGTNGLTGAVDTVMVLQRTRMSDRGKLSIMSRLMEDHAYACVFEKDGPRWRIEGDADQVAESEQQQAIMDALREAGCALRPAEIAHIIGVKNFNTVTVLLRRMEAADKVVRVGYGKYMLPEDGATKFPTGSDPSDPNDPSDHGDGPCSFSRSDSDHSDHSDHSVTLCSSGEGEEPIPEAMKAVRCPSCGRAYMWGWPSYASQAPVCKHCGADHPLWTQTTPSESSPTEV